MDAGPVLRNRWGLLATQGCGAASRDEDALILQVPGDGSVQEMRALLARLDDAAIEVDGLTVHTPDLDDVFFALTGHPSSRDNKEAAAR